MCVCVMCGQVIPVATFHDASEIHAYLNECEFGQQAAVFGTDHAEIASLIDVLVNVVCRVNINSQCQRGPDFFPFTYTHTTTSTTTTTTHCQHSKTPLRPLITDPSVLCCAGAHCTVQWA